MDFRVLEGVPGADLITARGTVNRVLREEQDRRAVRLDAGAYMSSLPTTWVRACVGFQSSDHRTRRQIPGASRP